MPWGAYDGGSTIGAAGSEGGTGLRDEEHALGARITLGRGGPTAPFAITCGIYGAMLHTAWASTEAGGSDMYDAMRARLTSLIENPTGEDYHAMLRRFADDF